MPISNKQHPHGHCPRSYSMARAPFAWDEAPAVAPDGADPTRWRRMHALFDGVAMLEDYSTFPTVSRRATEPP